MADVLFSDDLDSLEDEEVEVSPLDEESEDDVIDPLLFVQKYINSDDTLKRQRAARSLADAMRWTEGEADVEVVLLAAEQLSTDLEPRIRIDVIEELPDITAFCLEDGRSIDTILNRLLPILAKYLSDLNDQIRKSGHVILFSLLEHQLIGSVDVEHFMVPVLSQMSAADSCMSQLEAARVVMRVAPMMEPEVINRVFLPLIKTLVAAQYFEVRKTCASTFGPLSQAVDGDTNEKVVLPLFRALCTDSVWGVRKGCCETFVDVSFACTLEHRQDVLCPVFLSFLQDSSKWVQKAAYQVLGPFITTFHNPHSDYLSEDEKEESDILDNTSPIPLVDSDSPEKPSQDKSRSPLKHTASDELGDLNATDDVGVGGRVKLEKEDLVASEGFSSFLYWKTPLPDISVELKLSEDQASLPSKDDDKSEEPAASYDSFENAFDDGHQLADGAFLSCIRSQQPDADQTPVVFSESEVDLNFYQVTEHSWDHSSVGDVDSLVLKQDIVPEELLEHYVSMIEISQAQFIDPDLPLHCAYSFPGVAMTLGKEHWPCIKPIYGVLCSHMQWKVRRTLSFSLHEVARILGNEMTDSELVMVFDGFLKDLDEVRIGVLSHFSEFLELVSPEYRKRYLSYLPNFQQMDNSNNWRFRQALAEQLGQLCTLCEPLDIHTHVIPIAINLATDKVADVRLLAIEVLGKSLSHLKQGVDTQLADQLVEDIRNRFGLSSRWLGRQMFVRFCQSLLIANYISPSEFAENFLDPLLDLVSDSVANVRLAVSRAISENLLSIDLFKPTETNMSPHSLSVSLAVSRLLKDSDQDVRNFLAKLADVAGSATQDAQSPNALSENEEESGEELLDMSMEVEDSSLSEDVHDFGSSAEQSISGQGSGSEEVAGGDQS